MPKLAGMIIIQVFEIDLWAGVSNRDDFFKRCGQSCRSENIILFAYIEYIQTWVYYEGIYWLELNKLDFIGVNISSNHLVLKLVVRLRGSVEFE